jgi:hypothetical protein
MKFVRLVAPLIAFVLLVGGALAGSSLPPYTAPIATNIPGIVCNDTTKGAQNLAAIQAGLGGSTAPGNVGRVAINAPAAGLPVNGTPATCVVTMNTPAVIGSNTDLHIGKNVRLTQASGQNNNLFVSYAYSQIANFQTITGITWSSSTPLLATLNLGSALPGVTQDTAIIVKGTLGTTDPAFTGVFQVINAIDPANPIVVLRRMPAGAATGTIKALIADQHIRIEGGIFDYNMAQNSSPPNALANHAIIMYGVRDLGVRDIIVTNVAKFGLCLGAVSIYDVDGVEAITTNSDIVKVYGPAFDGVVQRVSGDNGDDDLSFQTEEASTFSTYDFTGGDVINATGRRINVTRGSGVGVYPTNGWWIMDGITLDDINMHAANLAGSAKSLIHTAGAPSGDAFPSSTIKSLYIKNVEARDLLSAPAISFNGTTVNYDKVEIEYFRSAINPQATNGSSIQFAQTGGEIKQLSISKSRFYLPAATSAAIGLGAMTQYREINIFDNLVEGQSISSGQFISATNSSYEKISLWNNRIDLIADVIKLTQASGNTPSYLFRDNYFNTATILNTVRAATVYFNGNTATGLGNGAVRATGSIAITLASGGGNSLPANSLWTPVSGSPTLTFVGNAADVQQDISATGIARSPDAIVNNTNAALGTLGVAGLVVGDHAAAGSGSWHLMTNPTGATY